MRQLIKYDVKIVFRNLNDYLSRTTYKISFFNLLFFYHNLAKVCQAVLNKKYQIFLRTRTNP